MNQKTDSTKIYTKKMLSNMDMADRTKGELKKTFTKEYEKNASDLDRYTKVQSMKKKLLTPKRTMEVADSLAGVGYTKVKSSLRDEGNKDKMISKFRTKEQVENSIQKLSDEGFNDLKNSYRYKSLALKAMNKNK